MSAFVDIRQAGDLVVAMMRAEREFVPERREWDNERDWRDWLTQLFPESFNADTGFSDEHARFWDWLWSIEPGTEPSPFVGIWPRGWGKTTSAQAACVALAARRKRSYGLYVSGTQSQADDRVDGVRTMLESSRFGAQYPDVASRAETKYSTSRGWRQNRLTTASGFRIDAIGLDTGVRGAKFDEQRPDFIVLDDIDEETDTPEATQKKISIMTRRLLPAGSQDVAVLAIQNMVIPDGIFARLAPESQHPADFLTDRIVSGPVPAVENLEYVEENGRATIVGGRATWLGMDLASCQRIIDREGISAFLTERQHLTRERGAKIYHREWWDGQNRYSVHDQRLLSQVAARVMSWDTAESLESTAAFSACIVGDFVPYRGGYALLIRDGWRDRVEIGGLTDAVNAMGRKWGFDHPRFQMSCIIEEQSSGRQLLQAARSNVATLRMTGASWMQEAGMLQPFRPRISKDRRGIEAARFCRIGRVWLPEPDESNASWLLTLEQELYSVPNAVFRDLSDSFSQLILQWQSWLAELDQHESEAA